MITRKIVRIDEEKCDGCGECVPACHEGAIQIIEGKARLVGENLCDGLGDCLGHCPQSAITVEVREADEYDEVAVKEHLAKMEAKKEEPETLACGCPGTAAMSFENKDAEGCVCEGVDAPSRLGHWPVQLWLLSPEAPYLKGSDLLIAADCTAYALGAFHDRLLAGKTLAITCPKFNDSQMDISRLASIFKEAGLKGITLAVMEVPCCQGLISNVKKALDMAGVDMAFKIVTVSRDGKVLGEEILTP